MNIKLSSGSNDLVNRDKIKNLKMHIYEINKIVSKKILSIRKFSFGQMIKVMSMLYLYYLIQIQK